MDESAKKTESGLALYHPLVSFGYFVAVIAGSLLFVHPIYGGISLLCAFLCSFFINGKGTIKTTILIGLPMLLFISIVNPLFNHRGLTTLFYINDNPITKEAMLYGIVSGIMMFSAVVWFTCYNTVVTSDKFLYVFGKALPSIALVVSMTLSLIPKLIAQIKIIADTQRSLGMDIGSGTIKQRLYAGNRILSILVSWALEDAVVTADSMSARGYGIGKRSSFSIFKFTKRDRNLLIVILFLFIIEIMAYSSGRGTLSFYPSIESLSFDITDIIYYISYTFLGIIPSIIQLKEDRKWKLLK